MIICIPVRMNSHRLLGKAMMKLGGKPLFHVVYENVIQSGYKAVVCIGKDQRRDLSYNVTQDILDYCYENKIPYWSGSEDDPVERFLYIAQLFQADRICRVTGDNPFTSAELIKQMAQETADYVYTDSPRGTRPEIIAIEPLRRLWETKQEKGPMDVYAMNEYLTYELMKFDKVLVKSNIQMEESFTVDTQEDFDKIEKIFNHFGRVPTLEELYEYRRTT